MRKIRTGAYLIGVRASQRRYMTFYQDLLDNYYYSFCEIEIGTERCVFHNSIKLCSKADVISFYCYPVCKTHYVDPAGSLRSVVPK
jgi:hypothetical protein